MNPNRVKANEPFQRVVWAVEMLYYGYWWAPTGAFPTRQGARDEISACRAVQLDSDRTKRRVVKYIPKGGSNV